MFHFKFQGSGAVMNGPKLLFKDDGQSAQKAQPEPEPSPK
jgi:hypothetical protein